VKIPDEYEKIALMFVSELKAMLIPELINLIGHGPEPYMTTPELAAYLKVSEDTIRDWANERGCPHLRVSKGAHRFRVTEVVAWLQSRL
jgi:excisionase family DNA binding protein